MLAILKKKSPLIAAALLTSIGLPSVSLASTAPSFNHVGLNYVNWEIEDDSFTGFGFDAEAMISDRVFLATDYLSVSDSFRIGQGQERISAKLELSLLHVNAGYQILQREGFVGYVSGGYSSVGAKAIVTSGSERNSSSDSESGYNVQVGIRSAVSDTIELDANARHVDISGSKDLLVNVGGYFKINPQFSVGLSYTLVNSDESYVSAGLRFHF